MRRATLVEALPGMISLTAYRLRCFIPPKAGSFLFPALAPGSYVLSSSHCVLRRSVKGLIIVRGLASGFQNIGCMKRGGGCTAVIQLSF